MRYQNLLRIFTPPGHICLRWLHNGQFSGEKIVDLSLSIFIPENIHHALMAANTFEYFLCAKSFQCMNMLHPFDNPTRWILTCRILFYSSEERPRGVESLGQGCTASKGVAQRVGIGASAGLALLNLCLTCLTSISHCLSREAEGPVQGHNTWNMETLGYKPRSVQILRQNSPGNL